MRKKIATMVLAGVMAMSMAMPAFALETPEWALVDASGYDDSSEWKFAENEAQTLKWVESVKGTIEQLPTQTEKFNAAMKLVTDSLEHDTIYTQYMSYYSFRDGYGVCVDYAARLLYLLESVGIESKAVFGSQWGSDHAWLQVTIDGVDYWSDPTSVDTGVTEPLIAVGDSRFTTEYSLLEGKEAKRRLLRQKSTIFGGFNPDPKYMKEIKDSAPDGYEGLVAPRYNKDTGEYTYTPEYIPEDNDPLPTSNTSMEFYDPSTTDLSLDEWLAQRHNG